MKIKVGVFFGGKSVEHEVSVISALQACRAFDNEKYEVVPVYIAKDGDMYCGEFIGDIKEYTDIPALLKKSQRVILVKNEKKFQLIRFPMKKFGDNVVNTIDVAVPIVHGTNVEDGVLQGYFQTIGIPYTGCDVISSAVGMDKYVMKTVLKDNGIPVLDAVTANVKDYANDSENIIELFEQRIGYPMIIKPLNLGSSVGIKIARDKDELREALEYAFEFSLKVICEHAIMNLKEVNCAVFGDYEYAEPSECEEPISSDEILSYENKYLSGGKSGKESGMASLKRKIPADITREQHGYIRETAVRAFKTLGCSGVARVDFMIDLDEDKIYLTEINTIPGSLAFYLWEPAGIHYSLLLDNMVTLALKRARESEYLHFSFNTNILSGVNLSGVKGGKLYG